MGIKTDKWTTRDYLQFGPIVSTLEEIIRDEETETPLTIGVHGQWGIGKTSLMRMLEERLRDDYPTIWFNPWRYGKNEVLWRALLLTILSKLEQSSKAITYSARKRMEDIELMLYRDLEKVEKGRIRIDLKKFGKAVIDLGLSVVPGVGSLKDLYKGITSKDANTVKEILSSINREEVKIYKDKISSFEQFEVNFKELISLLIEESGKLVIFLDDLDRCRPDKAVEILEGTKLFFETEGCVFVVAFDTEIIENGVLVKYREIIEAMLRGVYDKDQVRSLKYALTQEYIEKIIQLPVYLGAGQNLKEYVTNVAKELDYKKHQRWIEYASESNPRKVKRIINMFLFQLNVLRKTAKNIDEKKLGWMTALRYKHGKEYKELMDDPSLFEKLQQDSEGKEK